MWPLPRELLWAIIVALAIAVVSLWPLKYPYSQAPSIQTQQQTKDSVGGHDATQHGPAAPVDATGEQKDQHGGEHASEVTVLGIKPGEWLLGIVTWMLWLATARLVANADKTAARQLRAYVFVSDAFIRNLNGPEVPVIHVCLKNYGQTPAYKLTNAGAVTYATFPQNEFSRNPAGDQRLAMLTIPPGADIASGVINLPFAVTPEIKDALQTGKTAIWAFGRIEFEDIFRERRSVDYRFIFGGDVGTRFFTRDGVVLGAMAQTIDGNGTSDQ
ncbi:hypothetical protein HU230_0015955 [Bradyrhizobium quebecense]|uniref:Uncharacterized protein n=1 Tax=Bradyrhizobium quebecense TaxID=2748629 RepID=A0A973WPY5_9BRAD|nr:hypothetical protein [Bradyrhizobium quebecense]UGA47441.1 hypothetical protein HU230_0015955 [Bradyrhizobium quebecense]